MIHGIIQILLKDTKVIKAVGTGKNGKVKIYPVLVDEGEDTPFVAMLILSNDPGPCKDSTSAMDKVRFEISVYSKDYPEVDSIDNLIRFSIDGFKGVSAGLELDVWFENQRDGFDSNNLYARISQYSAFVKRSV